jgi:hypothetical protein
MIQNRWMIIIIVIMSLVISACSQQEELPTVVAFPTEIPPTEVEITVEPTLTPVPRELATLPPTWTNTPDVTATIEATATPAETATFLPEPKAVSVACDTFQIDTEKTTKEFFIGESPIGAWTAVDGAALYHVFLYDFRGRTINDQIYTEDTFWEFNPDHFELGENYIWAVWPLDSVGDQMCFERGLELLPQRSSGS